MLHFCTSSSSWIDFLALIMAVWSFAKKCKNLQNKGIWCLNLSKKMRHEISCRGVQFLAPESLCSPSYEGLKVVLSHSTIFKISNLFFGRGGPNGAPRVTRCSGRAKTLIFLRFFKVRSQKHWFSLGFLRFEAKKHWFSFGFLRLKAQNIDFP